MVNLKVQCDILRGIDLINNVYSENYNYLRNTLLYENPFLFPKEMGGLFLKNRTLYIPFRGTKFDTIDDILIDLNFNTEYLSNLNYQTLADFRLNREPIGFHKGGFIRYQNTVTYETTSILKHLNAIDVYDNVHIFGHSMGCWVATLFALDTKNLIPLGLQNKKTINLTLFAPPKMCTDSFKLITDILVDNSSSQLMDNLIKVNAYASQYDKVPKISDDFKQPFFINELDFGIDEIDEIGNHKIINFKEPIRKLFNNK